MRSSYLDVDEQRGLFRVQRDAFLDPEVLVDVEIAVSHRPASCAASRAPRRRPSARGSS